MEQTPVVRLPKDSHASCPKCGHPTAFFSGEKGAFASDERDFLADTLIQLECRVPVSLKSRQASSSLKAATASPPSASLAAASLLPK